MAIRKPVQAGVYATTEAGGGRYSDPARQTYRVFRYRMACRGGFYSSARTFMTREQAQAAYDLELANLRARQYDEALQEDARRNLEKTAAAAGVDWNN
jgi:hypothetical protein